MVFNWRFSMILGITGSQASVPSTFSIDLDESSSQYLNITDAAQTGLGITGDCTFKFWVKLDSLPSVTGWMLVIAKWRAGTSPVGGFYVAISGTSDKLRMNFSSDSLGATKTVFDMDEAFDSDDIGVWIELEVAVDVSAASVTFKKDDVTKSGTMVDNSATSIYDNAEDFKIGAYDASGSPDLFYNGKLFDVKVYDSLTQSGGNLQGNWFKDTQTADDMTANGNDLTENNSPTFSTDVP